jgi:membrane protease YdiL (CAAX protease family)
VALAEEIMYRGFIYTYLQQLTGENLGSACTIDSVFLYQHIRKMFVVASLAGLFYGLIYILTDNLLTAVIIHTVTNIVWRVFFVLILPTTSKSAVKSQIEVTKS